MTYNSLVPNTAGAAVYDPLAALEALKVPSFVPAEQSPYLLKLLLARLPQNRKVELSLHLYPKALDFMAHHNLWGMLSPFVPCLFKYQNSALEDPLLSPYAIYNPMHSFSFLKLLLARLPICDRAKVAYPLLVMAICFMHKNRLWHELSPFNSRWSTLCSRSSISQERDRGRGRGLGFEDRSRSASYVGRGSVGRGRSGRYSPGGHYYDFIDNDFDWTVSQPEPIKSYEEQHCMMMIRGTEQPKVEQVEADKSEFLAPISPAKDDFTSVDPLPVDSEAEASANLRPSGLKDVEDVDPFALHKIFCLLCATSEHSMVDCPETPPAKMVRIEELKLCEKCLSPGHFVSDCTELVVCVTCGLGHLDYIHHKPTDWIFQVSNVSTHLDVMSNDEQPPKQSSNSSCANLEDLLSTNSSDTTIQPIAAQHFLMTFDEL